MVGNDVVDLRDRDAKPSTLSARFDRRVFSDEELELLAGSPDRVRLRWTLWAAKEAAYKLSVKCDPAVIFSPSKFRVKPAADGASGVVEAGTHVVPFQVSEASGGIHAIAATGGNALLFESVRVEPEAAADLSRAVRELTTRRVAAELGVDPGAIEIRKRGRIPELFVAGRRAPGDLSLSHHGQVVGFAFEAASSLLGRTA